MRWSLLWTISSSIHKGHWITWAHVGCLFFGNHNFIKKTNQHKQGYTERLQKKATKRKKNKRELGSQLKHFFSNIRQMLQHLDLPAAQRIVHQELPSTMILLASKLDNSGRPILRAKFHLINWAMTRRVREWKDARAWAVSDDTTNARRAWLSTPIKVELTEPWGRGRLGVGSLDCSHRQMYLLRWSWASIIIWKIDDSLNFPWTLGSCWMFK